ncbi:MAG: NAD(P)-dependent oxidoreductase [Candidatus Andeanibacterium colombiense]|uniref:NAD(P)-dependent oxidoreductase n=1 Tax=Candidatus Andeanibacterium colombiense TaxID=3121345 RepID=A0AAJ6BMT5_9SPHN|nr:MAG: NAD(P)-dependent oxidoreductase [Sphingomonadaceae bacterium]
MKSPLLVPARFLIDRQSDWNDGDRLIGPDEIAGGLTPGECEAIEIMVTSGSTFDRALVEQLPNLGLVACFSTGIEAIETRLLSERGIQLTTAGGINAHDVADHALALFLARWHGIVEANDLVRSGGWTASNRTGLAQRRSLRGKNAGIVGLGRIGSEIAVRTKAHQMDVRWWGPREKPAVPFARAESLLDLARWADVLFLACAAIPENAQMIDADVIAAMGAEGLIINISRGILVDERALRAALANGSLGGASLDVFAAEPTDPADWAGVPNLVMSPHIAGHTREAGPAMFGALRENIRRYRAHQALLTPYFS